jgi:hypothetical protein
MMRTNPVEEWRRLTEHYRALADHQLEELATEFADLTPEAQQVLRGEMRSRGLRDPQASPEAPKSVNRFLNGQADSITDPPETANLALQSADPEEEDHLPREYTWKTVLCDCEEPEQAWQLGEMLRRAGIDCWIDGPRAGGNWELRYHRVLVAADQLDQAREIVSRPVPQDIVDESKATVPDFEPPKCPGCGAADPALESIDPVNAWQCESCGRRWVDAGGKPEDEPQNPALGAGPPKNGKSRPATGQLYPQGE